MVSLSAIIKERIAIMDDDNQFASLTDDELLQLIAHGEQLVKENGGVWDGMIKTSFTEQDYKSLSAAALYKMAIDETNYD